MELALRIGAEAVKGEAVEALTRARSALAFGALLSIFQAVDGIFTSIGIDRFGVEMEGNAFLRHLMVEFGHIPTLAVMKVLAIAVILGLVIASKQVRWVKYALGALSVVYLCAAIIPWTYILFIDSVA